MAQRGNGWPGILLVLLLLAAAACSPGGGATSEEELRKLAGEGQAVRARQETEENLRTLVKAYDRTTLNLGLLIMEDRCVGGAAREYFFQSGDDQYRIRCWLTATAYYTAPRDELVEVLTSIGKEGDRFDSLITFDRDSVRYPLAYYRNRGKVGGKSQPMEPQLSAVSTKLTWDHLYSEKPIPESQPCSRDDPPVRRCWHEPTDTSIRALRQRGMVFQLSLSPKEYHYVMKSGKTGS